jgi:hypothetical protein
LNLNQYASHTGCFSYAGFDAEDALLDAYRRADATTFDIESAHAAVAAYVPHTESARAPAARKYAGRATSRRGKSMELLLIEPCISLSLL